jgi:hypothetical protein
MLPSIEYQSGQIGDLRVVSQPHERTGREVVTGVEVNGEVLEPTGRFWSSLFHRFGLAGNVFRYFGYDEVFGRVVAKNPDTRLRLCVERPAGGVRRGRLLAVSNPRRAVLTYDQTVELLGRYQHGEGDGKPDYYAGVVTARHTPRSGEHGFNIGPDQFHNRFVVEVPVDGFGQPRIYLSLLRQVCANGAVGYSRSFRSDIRVGADAAYTLDRALGQFDHDEGFAALRQRFESSQRSWASVRETMQLQKVLARSRGTSADGEGASPSRLVEDVNRLAGDLHALYGVANLESLSLKRQRVLPAQCRVYDLINFASEVATHRAPSTDARTRLQAYIGTLVGDEYDLEGTAAQVPEFQDLFLNLN